MTPPFINPHLPRYFVLEVPDADGWLIWGAYSRINFAQFEPPSEALFHHGAGSPVYIRCVERLGDVLHCLAGNGDPFTYRVVELPDSRYPELSDLEALDDSWGYG